MIARDGDPFAAVSMAVVTSTRAHSLQGATDSGGQGATVATALAALIEARLRAEGLDPRIAATWNGFRITVTVPLSAVNAPRASADAAARVAKQLESALTRPIPGETSLRAKHAAADEANAADGVSAALRKVAGMRPRPWMHAAVEPWTECADKDVSYTHFFAPTDSASDAREVPTGGTTRITAAQIERWRSAVASPDTVAFAVVGPVSVTHSVVSAMAQTPRWKSPGEIPRADMSNHATSSLVAYPSGAPDDPKTMAHIAIQASDEAQAIAIAAAMRDPNGPLAMHLRSINPPWALDDATAGKGFHQGCIALRFTQAPRSTEPGQSQDLARDVGAVLALVDRDTRLLQATHLATAQPKQCLSGTDEKCILHVSDTPETAIEVAERAAWQTIASNLPHVAVPSASRPSVAIAVGGRKHQDALSEDRWFRQFEHDVADYLHNAHNESSPPNLTVRSRVEEGQPEAWVLVASECAAANETAADSGLSALVAYAAAHGTQGAQEDSAYADGSDAAASAPPGVTPPPIVIEPWVAPDGVGLLAHGARLPHESPEAHAARISMHAARFLNPKMLSPRALTRARSQNAFYINQPFVEPLTILANARAPAWPSALMPTGLRDGLKSVSDAAVLARAHALAAGPIRMAILANHGASQVESARATVARWLQRSATQRPTTATACTPSEASPLGTVRPGMYSTQELLSAGPGPTHSPSLAQFGGRDGTVHAYVAAALPSHDERARVTADVVVAWLHHARVASTQGPNLTSFSGRVLGWPVAPTLVMHVQSTQAALDESVLSLRRAIDALRTTGSTSDDVARAKQAVTSQLLAAAMRPHVRTVEVWRGILADGPYAPPPTLGAIEFGDVQAFAKAYLGDSSLIVVASRRGSSGQPAP